MRRVGEGKGSPPLTLPIPAPSLFFFFFQELMGDEGEVKVDPTLVIWATKATGHEGGRGRGEEERGDESCDAVTPRSPRLTLRSLVRSLSQHF